MGRADEVRARYEAELALAEIEDELAVTKQTGTPEQLHDVKMRLREARQVFRQQREGGTTAAPETVTVSAVVTEAGAQ